jgi:hypothetical protein
MSRIEEIKELIARHKRRLQKLKEKQASYGLDTPVHILTEIEDVELELEQLQTELETLTKGNLQSADIYTVRKVFSAPLHYGVAGMRIGLLHPNLIELIEQTLNINPEDDIQTIEIQWEEDYTFTKESYGPFVVKNPSNGKSIVLYVTSTEPEYSKSIRKDSISLSFPDREYLEVNEGAKFIEVVPAPNLTLKKISLIPAVTDFSDWDGWGDEEEEEEEE